jgi:hypothetical protein
MTSAFERLDPSFLRRGAVIDLNYLVDEDVAEHFKLRYFEHFPQPGGKHSSPFVTVDHLERTGPNEFYIIPKGPYGADQAHALGLAIDTRYVRQVRFHESGPGMGQLMVTEPLYDVAFGLHTWVVSGEQLALHYEPLENRPRLRPRHHYVNLNSMAVYLTGQLVRRFPRLRGYINPNHLFDYMVASKTLYHFATPTLLRLKNRPADEEIGSPHVFVDVKVKAMKRWLKRNQSALYQSAAKHQAVLDGMEDQIDTNVQAMVEADKKAKDEQTAAEADALEEEEFFLEDEEEGEGPDFNFLPVPEAGAHNEENL